ncbi:MAG TPA: hypothetical protein VF665_05630 [Longimicrobium sp.]|jgi:hypothetical protein|uniref:hypothetical protein n=1 Tax=Longimicrobium sp. TaxID=2029185 RepID=UPI002ED9ABB4
MASRIEELAPPRISAGHGPSADSWRHRVLSRLLGLQTDREVEMELEEQLAAEADLPERVDRNDPQRLALEARLRSLGHRPAAVWNFPVRQPIRKPDWRDRLRAWLGG